MDGKEGRGGGGSVRDYGLLGLAPRLAQVYTRDCWKRTALNTIWDSAIFLNDNVLQHTTHQEGQLQNWDELLFPPPSNLMVYSFISPACWHQFAERRFFFNLGAEARTLYIYIYKFEIVFRLADGESALKMMGWQGRKKPNRIIINDSRLLYEKAIVQGIKFYERKEAALLSYRSSYQV